MNVLGHQSLAVSHACSFGLSQQSHRPLHCTKVARRWAWQDCTPLMGGGALPAALTPRGRGSPRGSHPSNSIAHTPGRKVCRLMALHLSVWECPSKAVRDRPCGYYPGHSNAMCAGGMGRARELSSGRGPLQSCARARLEWEPRSWDEQKPTRAPECNLSMPCSALNTPWPPGAASERTQLS